MTTSTEPLAVSDISDYTYFQDAPTESFTWRQLPDIEGAESIETVFVS